MRTRNHVIGVLLLSLCICGLAQGDSPDPRTGRFDHLIRDDIAPWHGRVAERPDELPGYERERALWNAFKETHGSGWKLFVDRRTGAPLLAEGKGIRWFEDGVPVPPLSVLEQKAREFLAENRELFKVRDSELVFNPKGSGAVDENHWLVSFEREVDGIHVAHEKFQLYINYGHLVAFGGHGWGAIPDSPAIKHDRDKAIEIARSYMGLTAADHMAETPFASLLLVPRVIQTGRYRGPVGEGVDYHLAWRMNLRPEAGHGLFRATIDTETGEVLSFQEAATGGQVKGGVYGQSNSQSCPEGCVRTGVPMPYADVSTDADGADGLGFFECTVGSSPTTTLSGDFVRVLDGCDALSESTTCGADLDMGGVAGGDCSTPPGSDSGGNTFAARTTFYHASRVMEKARSWLPSAPLATTTVELLVNGAQPSAGGFSACNSYPCQGWTVPDKGYMCFGNGSANCRNVGETPGFVHHEVGHSIDVLDGAPSCDPVDPQCDAESGMEVPREAYADVVAMLQGRTSCIAEGHRETPATSCHFTDCGDCTGLREMDYEVRDGDGDGDPDDPTTPLFTAANCVGSGGVCGPPYCESYVLSETIWDLATRDLPDSGIDENTAWQITERLFYMSRLNASGPAFLCDPEEGTSSGCDANSWFRRFRGFDDDDPNPENGTPHAGAIFEAFDRHGIACGQKTDAKNQSSSSCTEPPLATPNVTITRGIDTVTLSWDFIPDAENYLILRNDLSCDYSFNVVATLPQGVTNFQESVPLDMEVFYRVQAVHSTCEQQYSDVSECLPSAVCPTARDCGTCATKPLACSLTDTGIQSCLLENGDPFTCPPGKTLHVKNCDCFNPTNEPCSAPPEDTNQTVLCL